MTAVDGRTERLRDLGDITFIEADVRGFDVGGYHTICNLGLLYHLTLPEQLDLLRACSRARVILETQVHVPGHVPPAAEPWGWEMVTEHGLHGVRYPEDTSRYTASIGNTSSFWPTERSLLEMFRRTGYRRVQLVEPMHHSKYGPRRFYILNG